MSMKALPLLFLPFSLPSIYIFARTLKKQFFGSIFDKHYAFDLLITGAGLHNCKGKVQVPISLNKKEWNNTY